MKMAMGQLTQNEDAEFYQEGEEFCQEELAGEVANRIS